MRHESGGARKRAAAWVQSLCFSVRPSQKPDITPTTVHPSKVHRARFTGRSVGGCGDRVLNAGRTGERTDAELD